jgi:hypothetical protein
MGDVYIVYTGQISGRTRRFCIHKDEEGRQEEVVKLLGKFYQKLGRSAAFFYILEYISALLKLQDPRLHVENEAASWADALREHLSEEELAEFPLDWGREKWGSWSYAFDPKDTVTGVVMFC